MLRLLSLLFSFLIIIPPPSSRFLSLQVAVSDSRKRGGGVEGYSFASVTAVSQRHGRGYRRRRPQDDNRRGGVSSRCSSYWNLQQRPRRRRILSLVDFQTLLPSASSASSEATPPPDSSPSHEFNGPIPNKLRTKQQLGSFESLAIPRDRAERERLVLFEDLTSTALAAKSTTGGTKNPAGTIGKHRDPTQAAATVSTTSRTVAFRAAWKVQQQYWQQHADRQANGISSSFLTNAGPFSSLRERGLEAEMDLQQESSSSATRRAVLGVDRVLFVVHDPVHTLGTGSDPAYILEKEAGAVANSSTPVKAIPVVRMDRGGEVTYHGPGQLVAYPVLDLRSYKQDIHWYVRALEEAVIVALRLFFDAELGGGGIMHATTASSASAIPYRDDDTTGVWIDNHKVAAVGVKCRRWITMHGVAVNVEPQSLDGFSGIVPCGLEGRKVGCVSQFAGRHVSVSEFAPYLRSALERVFCIRLVDANDVLRQGNRIKPPCIAPDRQPLP
jgi:lipoate-protein ligase B